MKAVRYLWAFYWMLAYAGLALGLASGFRAGGGYLVLAAIIGAVAAPYVTYHFDIEIVWGTAWLSGLAAAAAWIAHLTPWGWPAILGFTTGGILVAAKSMGPMMREPNYYSSPRPSRLLRFIRRSPASATRLARQGRTEHAPESGTALVP